VKQIATTAVRSNPIVDNVLNAKEYYEGTYKALKGKKPPTPRQFLSLGEKFDREERQRERALDRRIERMGRPRGIEAAERGR
jgi:hypothetical protein